MTPALQFTVTGALLAAIGLVGAFAHREFLRAVLSVNLLSSGTFLLLVAFAGRATDPRPDPVPQALVLTGIVVAVSATAVALGLGRRLSLDTGRDALDDEGGTPDREG